MAPSRRQRSIPRREEPARMVIGYKGRVIPASVLYIALKKWKVYCYVEPSHFCDIGRFNNLAVRSRIRNLAALDIKRLPSRRNKLTPSEVSFFPNQVT